MDFRFIKSISITIFQKHTICSDYYFTYHNDCNVSVLEFIHRLMLFKLLLLTSRQIIFLISSLLYYYEFIMTSSLMYELTISRRIIFTPITQTTDSIPITKGFAKYINQEAAKLLLNETVIQVTQERWLRGCR